MGKVSGASKGPEVICDAVVERELVQGPWSILVYPQRHGARREKEVRKVRIQCELKIAKAKMGKRARTDKQ